MREIQLFPIEEEKDEKEKEKDTSMKEVMSRFVRPYLRKETSNILSLG